jgi:hypothetical protein
MIISDVIIQLWRNTGPNKVNFLSSSNIFWQETEASMQ